MTPQQLLDELTHAEQRMHATRALLASTPPGAPAHHAAVMADLQATVTHMRLLGIMQTQEVMMLSLETGRLLLEVTTLSERLGLGAQATTLH